MLLRRPLLWCLVPFFLVGLLSAETLPEGEGWEQKGTEDGVAHYEREADAFRVKESWARVKVPYPPERVWAVLRDYSTFPEWSPYSKEARRVSLEGHRELWFHQMDLPWPVGNRHYTLEFQLTEPTGGSGEYRIDWKLAPEGEQVQCDCGVLTPVNQGVWILRPLDGGKNTELICQALTDPGGKLPGFAVRAANKRLFPKLLAAVRDRVASPRYQDWRPPSP